MASPCQTLTVIKYLLLALILSGCYNQKKATVQHGRAVATYPEIGADYCARTYPPDTKVIPGDTVITFDTIYTGGDIHFDTVYSSSRDTVYITRFVQGPHTIERQIIHDTIRIVDAAALDAANIDRKRITNLYEGEISERKKYQKRSRNYLWVLIAIGVLTLGGLYFKLRKR